MGPPEHLPPPDCLKRLPRRQRQQVTPSTICHVHRGRLKTSLIVLIHSFVISQSTPLHSAAMNGRLEICQCLVESKADVSLKNKSTSPLRLLHTVHIPPAPSLSVLLTFDIAEAVKLHSTWPTTAARLMSSNICRGCKSDLGAFAITNKRVYAQYHHHHTSQHRHHSQQ